MKKIKQVLLIDDDEITRFINQCIMEEMQVADQVLSMENEQDALDFLTENCAAKRAGDEFCPELIFMDLNMPFLNAFEFLDRLASNIEIDLNELYIVLLTSSVHRRDKEQALVYKVQDFINKPLTPDKVEAVVKNYHQKFNNR